MFQVIKNESSLQIPLQNNDKISNFDKNGYFVISEKLKSQMNVYKERLAEEIIEQRSWMMIEFGETEENRLE